MADMEKTTQEELEEARDAVEKAIYRWAQAWANRVDSEQDENVSKQGQVLVTALVWGAETSSLNPELNGYAARWIGAPEQQSVSASSGLAQFIADKFGSRA